MVNYRIAYDRFIRAAKKKNIEDGIVDKSMFNDMPGEVHHIRPRVLGGNNKFKNLVLLSYEDHAYAHLLLNLALLQEKKQDDVIKLNYTIPPFSNFRKIIKKKNPFRRLKVDVYVSGKNWPPTTMSIEEVAKYLCFMNHRNPKNELMLDGMFTTVVRTATFAGSKFGYKMMFHL